MSTKRKPQAQDLYLFRLLSDAQIASDGKRIAFVLKQMDKEKDYVSNIYVVDHSGRCVRFTSGDKDSSPRWSPDGTQLAFLSGRTDKAQIHLMPADGGESVPLTDRKLGAGVPKWSPDGTKILFCAAVSTEPEEEEGNDEETKKVAPPKIVSRASYKTDGEGYIGNRRLHLFLVDVHDKSVEQLTDGDFHDRAPAWSPDGNSIAFVSNRTDDWDYNPGQDVYLYSLDSRSERQVTSGHGFGSPTWNPEGTHIACDGRADPQEQFLPSTLYSVDVATGEARDLLPNWDWHVGNVILSDIARSDEGVDLDWRQDGLYFTGVERGEGNIYRITSAGEVESVTAGGHNVISFSIADDGTIAFVRADATHPAEILVKAPDAEPRRLTHENDDLLEQLEIRQPERFTFVGAEGETNDGWLLTPDLSGGKAPLLVYIHGGPMMAHGESLFFEYQLLTGQGYGVFFPNIHGSGTYGRAYQGSIFADWGNKDFIDVMAGTREAMKRDWVDEERVGIMGGSYGGYMTLWALSHSDLFRAGIAERSLSNFISFFGTSDTGWAWNRMTGVYPEEDVQKLWNISPLKYVAGIEAPVMIVHYERDDRTPIEQGEQIFNALRRLGKTTKFVIFPEESHGMTRAGKPSRRVERLGIILDWLDTHLKNATA